MLCRVVSEILPNLTGNSSSTNRSISEPSNAWFASVIWMTRRTSSASVMGLSDLWRVKVFVTWVFLPTFTTRKYYAFTTFLCFTGTRYSLTTNIIDYVIFSCVCKPVIYGIRWPRWLRWPPTMTSLITLTTYVDVVDYVYRLRWHRWFLSNILCESSFIFMFLTHSWFAPKQLPCCPNTTRML
jgi:hypothetical protein